MTTIDLIGKNKTMLAVIIKCEEAGFDVLKADSTGVEVKANCLPVEIAWEMCSCHGGRMWFSQKNTGIHIELSSDRYDEEKGIIDPETELAYYIDNEMIKTIKSFEDYIYRVEVVGEYTTGKIETRYFNSIEKASYFVFHENGHDLNEERGEVIHQYPNPDMQESVTFVGKRNNTLLYKGKKLEKGTIDREYDIVFNIFQKKDK